MSDHSKSELDKIEDLPARAGLKDDATVKGGATLTVSAPTTPTIDTNLNSQPLKPGGNTFTCSCGGLCRN